MRIIAGLLLVGSVVVHLLLGGGYILSSRYEQFKAEIDSGDLSAVAKDLDLSEAELNKLHAQAKEKSKPAGRRQLVLGIILLASACLQILATVLVFLRRQRQLALGLPLLALAALLGLMIADGFITIAALAAGFLALALILAYPGGRRREAEATGR